MTMDAVLGAGAPFFKMQGCGNDFVLLDNRELGLDPAVMPQWAEAVCRKAFGVGADGLILLDNAPEGASADYIWHFFNADGSRAEMCGNGARCAARLAYLIGLAPERHILGTDAGDIEAEVYPGTNTVKVLLTPPKGLKLDMDLDVDGRDLRLHFVDTGVPHAVIFTETLEDIDVLGLGRLIRRHERFAPAGTNVNFARVNDPERIDLRTYERGVEDETYACGTGAAATALVARSLGKAEDEVEITTTGGERLGVVLEGSKTHLRGAAEIVFRGTLFPGAMGLDFPA